MADKKSISDATISYLQKFDHDYPGEKYAWFSEMLHGRCPDQNSCGSATFSNIRFVDDISEDMRFTSDTKLFDATKGREVDNDFIKALTSYAPDTSVRLIILHFTRMHDLNFSYLAHLGSKLDIDPLFFVMHFEHSRAKYEPFFRDRAPAMLPLESRYLQFCYDIYGHVTVTTLRCEKSKVNTVVMLLEPGIELGSQEDMPAMVFLRALSQLQISKQPLTKKISPIEYMAPLLHAAAIEFATFLDGTREHVLPIQRAREEADSLAASWKGLQIKSLMLDGITHSLDKALQNPQWSQGLSKKRISRLHKEYIALTELHKSMGEQIRDGVQQLSALQSILETKKGLQQADSVKRLSLVAMFFIPLSFATSFLGMNVEQLGTGKTDIRYFFMAAAIAAAITIVLTLIVKPLDRAMNETKERMADDFGIKLEEVGTRFILRESRIGQRVIDAMTIPDAPLYHTLGFREVFKVWCGFHFRKLWATVTRTRSSERSTEA